jgi:hypothetical protein
MLRRLVASGRLSAGRLQWPAAAETVAARWRCGRKLTTTAAAAMALGASGGLILGSQQVGSVCATAEPTAASEEQPAAPQRTPHALYVWGGNGGCTVPQSGAAFVGTVGGKRSPSKPEVGVAESGGARGLPAVGGVPVVGRPRAVPFFDDKGVKAIAFAAEHACLVDGRGKLWVWGAAHAESTPCCATSRERASQPRAAGAPARAPLVTDVHRALPPAAGAVAPPSIDIGRDEGATRPMSRGAVSSD